MTDAEHHRRVQIAIEGADHLLSINDAMRRGYTRLRLDRWANPDDYMEFYIYEDPATHEKSLGPWGKLWSPVNEIVGNKNPHTLLILELDLDDPCWRALPKMLVRP